MKFVTSSRLVLAQWLDLEPLDGDGAETAVLSRLAPTRASFI